MDKQLLENVIDALNFTEEKTIGSDINKSNAELESQYLQAQIVGISDLKQGRYVVNLMEKGRSIKQIKAYTLEKNSNIRYNNGQNVYVIPPKTIDDVYYIADTIDNLNKQKQVKYKYEDDYEIKFTNSLLSGTEYKIPVSSQNKYNYQISEGTTFTFPYFNHNQYICISAIFRTKMQSYLQDNLGDYNLIIVLRYQHKITHEFHDRIIILSNKEIQGTPYNLQLDKQQFIIVPFYDESFMENDNPTISRWQINYIKLITLKTNFVPLDLRTDFDDTSNLIEITEPSSLLNNYLSIKNLKIQLWQKKKVISYKFSKTFVKNGDTFKVKVFNNEAKRNVYDISNTLYNIKDSNGVVKSIMPLNYKFAKNAKIRFSYYIKTSFKEQIYKEFLTKVAYGDVPSTTTGTNPRPLHRYAYGFAIQFNFVDEQNNKYYKIFRMQNGYNESEYDNLFFTNEWDMSRKNNATDSTTDDYKKITYRTLIKGIPYDLFQKQIINFDVYSDFFQNNIIPTGKVLTLTNITQTWVAGDYVTDKMNWNPDASSDSTEYINDDKTLANQNFVEFSRITIETLQPQLIQNNSEE